MTHVRLIITLLLLTIIGSGITYENININIPLQKLALAEMAWSRISVHQRSINDIDNYWSLLKLIGQTLE